MRVRHCSTRFSAKASIGLVCYVRNVDDDKSLLQLHKNIRLDYIPKHQITIQ